MTGLTHQDAEQGHPAELAMLIVTGAVHVGLELLSDGLQGPPALGRPQHVFNIVATLGWGGYAAWRVLLSGGAMRAWGFRIQGFRETLTLGLMFGGPAAVLLLLYGYARGHWPLPETFFVVAGLYPVWGLAQEFALQAFGVRNLSRFVRRKPLRMAAAGVLFSAAHFPNPGLMLLTAAGGPAFAWLYERHRNLWALGLLHGCLGALAYYAVLGVDPGALLLDRFRVSP